MRLAVDEGAVAESKCRVIVFVHDPRPGLRKAAPRSSCNRRGRGTRPSHLLDRPRSRSPRSRRGTCSAAAAESLRGRSPPRVVPVNTIRSTLASHGKRRHPASSPGARSPPRPLPRASRRTRRDTGRRCRRTGRDTLDPRSAPGQLEPAPGRSGDVAPARANGVSDLHPYGPGGASWAGWPTSAKDTCTSLCDRERVVRATVAGSKRAVTSYSSATGVEELGCRTGDAVTLRSRPRGR